MHDVTSNGNTLNTGIGGCHGIRCTGERTYAASDAKARARHDLGWPLWPDPQLAGRQSQAVDRLGYAEPSVPGDLAAARQGLRHTHRIGFTTRHGRINRFDSIYVDGWREPIRSIVALDRRTARSILRY